ncbi:MAG: TonB-dependent receptor [Saprospiraceae bacterium]
MKHRRFATISRLLVLLFWIFQATNGFTQTYTETIRGTVVDADTGMPLVGATVFLSQSGKGTTTDSLGKFHLSEVPIGRHQLQISFVGYQPINLTELLLESGKELVLQLSLSESAAELASIVVRAPRGDIQRQAPTVKTLTVEETLRFPATFFDPARLVTTFAGVAQDNDQANGISIRGQSPNNLLWRLEGVDIVNPNHTPNAGTFSDQTTANGGGVNILSAQLLGTSYFHTGAFPVAYGNALSGVMDMYLRQGNNEKQEFTAQAGVIGIELASEGPFNDDTEASYLVNYRYSFVGLLSLMGVQLGDEDISFQDLSFNLVFPAKNGSKLTLFGMGGVSDNIFNAKRDSTLWDENKDRFDIDYASKMGAIGGTYSMPIGTRGSWRTSIALSALSSRRNAEILNTDLEPQPWEEDYYEQSKLSAHSFYQHKLNPRSRLRMGLHLLQQSFDLNKPGENQPSPDLRAGEGLLFQPYFNWQTALAKDLNLNAGLHVAYYDFNQHSSFEPRASIEWTVASKHQLSLAYGLHSQLQQPQLYFAITNNNQSNQSLDFSKAHHLVLGYQHHLNSTTLLSGELYYQSLFNIPIAANEKNAYSAINQLENSIAFPLVNEGTGTNYGFELSLQKYATEGIYYLFNASLYESTYKGSDGIERDTRFNGNYIFNATLGKEWTWQGRKNKDRTLGINGRIAYLGGFRATPIDVQASITAGATIYRDELAFTIQQKDYFRTDLRFYYKTNKANTTNTWSLDIQNATNETNVAFSYFDPLLGEVIVKNQLTLIPILSYRVSF